MLEFLINNEPRIREALVGKEAEASEKIETVPEKSKPDPEKVVASGLSEDCTHGNHKKLNAS